MMEKLKMQTPNLVDKNVEQIGKIFPEVITETKDDDGNLIKGIDFDLLKQKLSNVLVEDENERYRLDWPGKKASLLKANTPITKTLRPVIEESVDFEKTENLYIEGDNFEVLKILQESYLGKVKMICIDPPYNTGKDFIYMDNFKKSEEIYSEEIGAVDDEGSKLFRNTDTNGRFHSDWLSMVTERLIVARDLLKSDGVLFITIDDNESHNLRKICDEIYGEENFVADVCVINNLKGRNDKRYIATANERLLMYVKSESYEECGLKLPEERYSEFNKEDEVGKYRELGLRKRGGADTRIERPNMFFPLYVNPLNSEVSLEKSKDFTEEVLPRKSDGIDGCWRWGKETVKLKIKTLVGKSISNGSKWDVFEKDYLESNGELRKIKPKSVFMGSNFSTDRATKEYRSLLREAEFDSPKSVSMIADLIEYSVPNTSGDIILDFFSGSATTAHAVLQVNADNMGNRKFIMVQLPETTGENSETYKAGYRTIADIGKERIRRAGKKIKEEFLIKYNKELEDVNKELEQETFDGSEELQEKKAKLEAKIEHIKNLDTGFRVYRTDSSNMKDVFYHPTQLTQQQLSAFESNIKEDRTPEDLLTQVILDLGLELSLPIEKKDILGNNVFIVQENALVACFDDSIDFGIVDKIADLKPLKVVFKDASFKDDKDRVNVEERFKRLSPETIVSVI